MRKRREMFDTLPEHATCRAPMSGDERVSPSATASAVESVRREELGWSGDPRTSFVYDFAAYDFAEKIPLGQPRGLAECHLCCGRHIDSPNVKTDQKKSAAVSLSSSSSSLSSRDSVRGGAERGGTSAVAATIGTDRSERASERVSRVRPADFGCRARIEDVDQRRFSRENQRERNSPRPRPHRTASRALFTYLGENAARSEHDVRRRRFIAHINRGRADDLPFSMYARAASGRGGRVRLVAHRRYCVPVVGVGRALGGLHAEGEAVGQSAIDTSSQYGGKVENGGLAQRAL